MLPLPILSRSFLYLDQLVVNFSITPTTPPVPLPFAATELGVRGVHGGVARHSGDLRGVVALEEGVDAEAGVAPPPVPLPFAAGNVRRVREGVDEGEVDAEAGGDGSGRRLRVSRGVVALEAGVEPFFS